MLCQKPFVKAGAAYPCGQCKPCRLNRRRVWAGRIMLESLCHAKSSFVTLTYSTDKLPVVGDHPVLVPKHLQDFLKRLRQRITPRLIRFYGVGEYGEDIISGDTVVKYGRPHYHIILFGYPPCVHGQTVTHSVTKASRWSECCANCGLIGDLWGNGDVFLGGVTRDSSSYVAEYTVKKMTAVTDPRLKGRPPEFCRMSLRPGIGADAMWDVASTLLQYGLDEVSVDVPAVLGVGKSSIPLGRYLRSRLRGMIGKDGGCPEEVFKAMAEEMRPLREAAFLNSSSFAQAIIDDGAQRVANMEARLGINMKGRKL